MSIPPIKKPPPDPKAVYDHADRFHITEFVLRNEIDTARTGVHNTIKIPGMVLSAFAAELYLKCLLLLEGTKPPREHNLYKLFLALSADAQTQVKAQWTEAMAATEHIIREMETTYNLTVPRDLDTALLECGDSFELLRYVFEGHQVKFYITQLPLVVRNTIRGVTGWT